jgi:hypothetical protein
LQASLISLAISVLRRMYQKDRLELRKVSEPFREV